MWPSLKFINSSIPGQNGRHFADILKCIFMNEKFWKLIQISSLFLSPIDNKSALVQVMSWRRTGDKPLPEPVLAEFTDAYMHKEGISWLTHLPLVPHVGAKSVSKPMLGFCQLDP